MLRPVEVEDPRTLEEYAAEAALVPAVERLRERAARTARELDGHTVWMVNSTAQGGGVAEMLPHLVGLLRDLGIRCEWAVIGADDPAFFDLTKRIHNLIHGDDAPRPAADERRLFERVNRAAADAFLPRLRPGDVLAVHDPQPMPLAAALREEVSLRTVWRCHIGLDEESAATRDAWEFLRPYAQAYRHAVFSTPDYVPPFFADRASVIFPAIDPLAEKNRELHVNDVAKTLQRAGLTPPVPGGPEPFPEEARLLDDDGRFGPAPAHSSVGFLERPLITQVSRWDRLKGQRSLIEAFTRMKRDARRTDGRSPEHHRMVEQVRLVVAGPDPASIQDDPEGLEVLDDLRRVYTGLDPDVRADVALVSLPMDSRRRNARMVNALQRTATVVAQNSLREGFGLTITEGMWKRVPVLTNARACGPRHQVRDGREGRVVSDPEDVRELSTAMDEMLADAEKRRAWGRAARRRVHEKFLVFAQLEGWLRVLEEVA